MLTSAFSFLFLTGARCAIYVPKVVFESKWFWILLSITTAVIIIRHNLILKSKGRNTLKKRLEYRNEGRGGTVIYTDEISSIHLNFEFGGGNCVAIIFIPTVTEWEKTTNRRLDERNHIIEFIARQSQLDQVSGGWYEIKDQYIELYSNKV